MVWKTVDVQSLHVGNIVARDVNNRSGKKLIGAGTSITANHLETLKAWGIFTIDVMDTEDPNSPAEKVPPTHHSSEVMSKFKLNDVQHPMIERLMQLAEQERQHERAR